jgi:hypothetical protein
LASSEFTPSNIHLSNFLKQIFGDELEREKELMLRNRDEESRKQAIASADAGHGEEVLELEDVGGRALTDSNMPPAEAAVDDDADIGRVNTEPGRPSVHTRSRAADGELRLKLSEGEIEALKRIAEAKKTTIDSVARELLRAHLKWM